MTQKKRAAATANAKNLIKNINCFLPLYTPKTSQKRLLSEHIVSKAPTDLRYIERSVFQKNVKAQNGLSFELAGKSEINSPIYVFVYFQERVWPDKQEHKTDVFVGFPVFCAQWII